MYFTGKRRVFHWGKRLPICRFPCDFPFGAIEQASEPSEFREINLNVAEIRRGSVEWKIELRHRVWFTTTFLAFNIQ